MGLFGATVDPPELMLSRCQAGSLLVVAGESSGDRMAAAVIQALARGAEGENSPSLPAASPHTFGLGGEGLSAQGVETVFRLEDIAVMGLWALVPRAAAILRIARGLMQLARNRRPQAALLVGFSELNGWLGPRLRQLGIRVLWYAAPQVWAWRPGRIPRYARAADTLAVLLPFEREVWAHSGVETHYVGHPALDRTVHSALDARRLLGIVHQDPTLLLLPGSRPQEISRLTPLLLGVAQELQREGVARSCLALAPSLAQHARGFLEESCRQAGIPAIPIDPSRFSAFDLALACSGTVTLECAWARVPPIIVYRTDPLTAWAARSLMRVDFTGLPNLILERHAFPELLQGNATIPQLKRAALDSLKNLDLLRPKCDQVRRQLQQGVVGTPAARVAGLLRRWLPPCP